MNVKLKLSFLIGCLLISHAAIASFNKNLWPKWEITSPMSNNVISHEEWQTFLNQHVITNSEGINLIDYPNMNEEDRMLLKQYITHMSAIKIGDYNRQEQLAYWINLYNALTVQTIASYYPVESIQEINISPGLFSIGPWGANLITIEGIQMSLEDIHNRIIRPIWNDPRTHYVLNNGSIGAANISKYAFQSATLDKQLNQAAIEYINSLRGVQVIDGKLIVSKLYDWFSEDFGGTEKDIINHLTQFANQSLRQQLSKIKEVNTYNYNWHLNTTVDFSA
ncbi:DUF547 domain-containing protein [Legionella yabuuchiae]|uniref:DUF547 domain-containing protein n=1 Tax=Legionella yabuuchiae TaxID=376727 RepID=UPI001F5F659E|nr:DUF547 domain-containing protein [Legionella yabuuchiae]